MTTCPKCNHVFKPKKGNKRYKKGTSYEYIVKRKLEEKGYEVHRAYASRGTFDLIAIKGDIRLGIQVKSLSQKNKAYLTPKDRESLRNELINESGDPYILLKWNQKKHAAMEIEISRPIEIIHAYKDGLHTKYMKLVDTDEWKVFKP